MTSHLHYLTLYKAAVLSWCITFVAGVIECECTTKDCLKSGRTTCQAENLCYVQYLPGIGETTDIMRGCIDNKTPLLCENRRPLKLTPDKPWPILYCCKHKDGCNRNVLPAIPDNINRDSVKLDSKIGFNKKSEGHTRANLTKLRIEVAYEGEGGKHNLKDSAAKSSIANKDNNSEDVMSINPIFVAIPTIGILVFLLLIFIALYLLRRRNSSYRRNLSLYKSHMIAQRLGISCRLGDDPACRNHANGVACNHGDVSLSNHGGRLVCNHSEAFVPHIRCSDSERSSDNGSETKLFMPT